MAKGFKTGGRQKGSANRVTAAKAIEVAESGLTPLDFMIAKLRDETASDEDRKWAAQNAAPYVHPKLSSIDASVKAEVRGVYDWLLGKE